MISILEDLLSQMAPGLDQPGSMVCWAATSLFVLLGIWWGRRNSWQGERRQGIGLVWLVLAWVWLGLVGRWWWTDGAGAVSMIDRYVMRPGAAAWPWFGAGRAMFFGFLAALGFAGIGVAALAALSWRGRPWIAAPTGIIAATAALGAGLIASALKSKDLWHLHGHAVHDSCMHSSYDVAVLASAGLGLLALPAAFSPLLAPRAQG